MSKHSDFIGYGRQWIDKDDIEAVRSVLTSDFLTQGPRVLDFENALCDYTGSKYCIAVANGTAALHLAVAVLNFKMPAHGITSPNTFLASANSMVYCGITPGFSDIDPTTFCIDPKKIPDAVTPDTQLIIPVHFAGQACEMKTISSYAKSNDYFVVEDAAHAIGSLYEDGSRVGNGRFSDLTTFSFHPVKTITTGEGGAILTNDLAIYQSLKQLREHGMSRKDNFQDPTRPWVYKMTELGYNYRLNELQAALGLSQLKKIDSFIEKRKEIVSTYNQAFEQLDWIQTPSETNENYTSFHLYVVQIDFSVIKKTRAEAMNQLKMDGIGSQVHYIPVHTQPFYKDNYNTKEGDCPIAESYYQKTLSLPLFPKMSALDIERVIKAVKSLAI
jgi:UDP-4-amino-4,6-dideoxy-N-acetyl-beta-L-altrosamine transaminase